MTQQELAKILSANNELLLKKMRRVFREELEMALERSSSSMIKESKRKSSVDDVDINQLRKRLQEKHGSIGKYYDIDESTDFNQNVNQSDIKTLSENFVDPDNPDRKLNVDATTVSQIFKDYGDII